jgi:arylsulfatase A-like enzyme
MLAILRSNPFAALWLRPRRRASVRRACQSRPWDGKMRGPREFPPVSNASALPPKWIRLVLPACIALAGCSGEGSSGAEVGRASEARELAVAPGAEPPSPTRRGHDAAATLPNVVVVSIDTFRADRIGRKPSITPNMDRFASQGVVFERAVTPMGTTLPALATLFTGLYPREHGLRWNGDSLRPEFATLGEVFQRNGYATAAFVSFFDVVYDGGLGQGFDTRIEVATPVSANLSAEEVNRQALPWLARVREEPIFAWIHYFEPHEPYAMTDHARQRLPDRTGIYANGASVDDFYRFNEFDAGLNTPENRAILEALYDSEVVEVDRAFGEILEAVDPLKTRRATVVILTADHGQLLGEHNAVGHGFTVWEEILHVPLIVRDSRRPDHKRIETRVGLVDLFPTLVELAGLEVAEKSSGRSIVPALDGETLAEAPYYAETRIPPPPSVQVAVLYGDRKLQKFEDEVARYDLARDPREAERGQPGSEDRDLLRRLERFGSRQHTAGIDAPADDPAEVGRDERLIALGYAVASPPDATAPPLELTPDEAVAIIQRFGETLAVVGQGEEFVFDASRLPDPKPRVESALLQLLELVKLPEERRSLSSALLRLAYFQSEVGEAQVSIEAIGPDRKTWRSRVEAELKKTTATLARRGL